MPCSLLKVNWLSAEYIALIFGQQSVKQHTGEKSGGKLCWLISFALKMLAEKKTPWSESASELYRPSDRRLSSKRLPTFADRGFHVVSVTDPYGRILGFLDRIRYFSIK
jgi:hypothetical protein